MNFPQDQHQGSQYPQYANSYQQHPGCYPNQMADSGHYGGPLPMDYPAMQSNYGANHHDPNFAPQASGYGWDHYASGMHAQYGANGSGMSQNAAQYSNGHYGYAQGMQNGQGYAYSHNYDAQMGQQQHVPQPQNPMQSSTPAPHGSWNGGDNGYSNSYGGSSFTPADSDSSRYDGSRENASRGGYDGNQHTVHFNHQPMKPSKRGHQHSGKQFSVKSVRSDAAQGRLL